MVQPSRKYRKFKEGADVCAPPSGVSEDLNALQDEWIDSGEEEEEEEGERDHADDNEEDVAREMQKDIKTTMKATKAGQHANFSIDPSGKEAEPEQCFPWHAKLLILLLAGTSFLLLTLSMPSFNSIEPVPPAPPPAPPSPAPPPWEKFWMRPQPPPWPLPPAPPPRPLNSRQVVKDLNSRFAHAKPSNTLSEAGVMLHTFDAPDAARQDLWNPCPKDWWCGKYADRLSASVVTPRIRSYFWAAMGETSITKAMGGFVLDSRSLQPANSSVLCSWGADAGTLGMLCDPLGVAPDRSCIPGCRSGFQCGTQANLGDYCWWPPHQLKSMLELHEARPRTDDHGCNQWDCKYVQGDRCVLSRKILLLQDCFIRAFTHPHLDSHRAVTTN